MGRAAKVRLAAVFVENKKTPFKFIVVDEAQDIGVAHLRFFAALGSDRPNSLFFAGDLGQRIFHSNRSRGGLSESISEDARGRFT